MNFRPPRKWTSGRMALALGLLIAASLTLMAGEAQSPAATSPKPYPERLQWWADARLGMFIHWGPVSLKGTEISWSRANTNPLCPNRGEIPAADYDVLYKEFNPEKFSADAWMETAKAAGMKYIVFVAKHCDGFLLWNSPSCNHNIMASPFKRDLVTEVAAAARRHGLKVGMYFSPPDWRDPDFRTERNAAFVARMQEQLRELLTNYGKIDLLWFDYDLGQPLYDQENTYKLVRSLQPGIIIDNRLDLGRESNRLIKSSQADYYTPEHAIGEYDDQTPWESAMTMSYRDQWAYGGPEDGVKPFEAFIKMLVGSAGGDGNLLLNVGPMPTGEIPLNQVERLKEIGSWLEKFGESIYGTRGGPFKPGEFGSSTRKGKTIYLHIRNWETDTLQLPAIAAKVVNSRILTGAQAGVVQKEDGSINVTVPESDRDPLYTIVALDLDSDALAIPAVTVPRPPSLTSNATATASNIYRGMAQYGADKAVDGQIDTRWATDEETTSAWLELDLGKPVTFDSVAIMEEYSERQGVQSFALESWQDGQWKSFYDGATIGMKFRDSFPPVTAQRVRLNIIAAKGGPTITEFLLFSSEKL